MNSENSEHSKPVPLDCALGTWRPIETAPEFVTILIYQPRLSRITLSINDGTKYTEATHWMPLPAPPEST